MHYEIVRLALLIPRCMIEQVLRIQTYLSPKPKAFQQVYEQHLLVGYIRLNGERGNIDSSALTGGDLPQD